MTFICTGNIIPFKTIDNIIAFNSTGNIISLGLIISFKSTGHVIPFMRIDIIKPLQSTDNTTIQLNPFPNKPWFLRVCNTSLLKTMWEEEQLFVTFCHLHQI